MGTCIKIEYLVALANWTLLISHNSLHSIFHVYQWSWFYFLRYSCFSSIFSLNLSFCFCLSSTFLVCLLIFKRFQSFYSFVLFFFFFFFKINIFANWDWTLFKSMLFLLLLCFHLGFQQTYAPSV